MIKKVLKMNLKSIVEVKPVKRKIDGQLVKTLIPTKEDVVHEIAAMFKSTDEDDFYEFANLLCSRITIYYSPTESIEGNTMKIPSFAMNVITKQYYDNSMIIMMNGQQVVYVLGDEELIDYLREVSNQTEVKDEKDLETIPELIEIYPSKGFWGREIKYGRY